MKMTKYALIEITYFDKLRIGDKILIRDKVVEVKLISRENTATTPRVVVKCPDGLMVTHPKFNSYYKVIKMGKDIKITNWKERIQK
jgi:hypothetical protein